MNQPDREHFLFSNDALRVHIQKFRASDWREEKEEAVFFDLDLAMKGSENPVVELTQFYPEKVHTVRVEYPNSVAFSIRGQPHVRISMECKSEEEATRELARLNEFFEHTSP